MLGKLTERYEVNIESEKALSRIDEWAARHELKNLGLRSNGFVRYRFGSPMVSNPIIIEVDLSDSSIATIGWVETLIPFFRLKLIETSKAGVGTTLDYRRKGGLFLRDLRQALPQET